MKGATSICLATACALSISGIASGQTATSFEVYTTFSDGEASDPVGRLVEGPDGSLYGTSRFGGLKKCNRFVPTGCGTVFRITPDGQRIVMHVFAGTDGAFPNSGLTFGADGDLYGVTQSGGAPASGGAPFRGSGTVFRITTSGVLTTLHAFAGGADGASPDVPLTRMPDGTLYGTTHSGGNGVGCTIFGCGTTFKIANDGTFSILYRFRQAASEGFSPIGPLVAAADGNLYGLTHLGGTGSCLIATVTTGCGTVFRMTPSGVVTTIHSFAPVMGRLAFAADLLFDAAGNTLVGSTTGVGCAHPDANALCRVLFRLTLTGTMTTPYVFEERADSLVLFGNGDIYGMAGATVFRLTPDFAMTTVHDFSTDPGFFYRGLSLVRSASGDLLGTSDAGPNCTDPNWYCGVIFRIGLFDSADVPNLTIKSFKTPSKVAAGATLTLNTTIANNGAAPTTPSETTFWLSKTSSLADAQLLSGQSEGPLPASASTTRSQTVTLPPDAPGRYTLIARADTTDAVHEILETDNTKRRALIVGPDLTIHQIFPSGVGISLDPMPPTSAAPTSVSVYTANIGGDAVGPSTTYLYASPTRMLDAHSVLLATIPNVPMNPHEHNHVIVPLTLPAGTYYLVAKADAVSAIAEASEDNNVAALKVIVP